MRIGILTLHSQVNYGAVLQAYAMQKTLESMGHEACIIDCWFDKNNSELRGNILQKSIISWLKIIVRSLLGLGDFGKLLRHCRIIRFLKHRLKLTGYHFTRWSELQGKDMGLDVIIVGSDQVWTAHSDHEGIPSVYFLEGAPVEIPAIAYAASFGMQQIPETLFSMYRLGFQRFSSISVRDKKGVFLVKSAGYKAVHVCDPTLLAELSCWAELIGDKSENKTNSKILTCYLLEKNYKEYLPVLEKFSKQNSVEVEIFMYPFRESVPRNFSAIRFHLRKIITQPFSRVKIRQSASPEEFVRSFSHASWIITDSFHGLMFSIIGRKNVRILYPQSDFFRRMFVRFEECVQTMFSSSIICYSLEEALKSFANGDQVQFNEQAITEFQDFSRKWLHNAIENIQKAKKDSEPSHSH